MLAKEYFTLYLEEKQMFYTINHFLIPD